MLQIQVLSVTVSTKTSAAGKPYQNAEVAYKNLTSGKVESKNITSYSKVFKDVSEMEGGQVFNVDNQKNEKTGYWDWMSVTRSLDGAAPPAAAGKPAAATPVRSTYETPEERAQKQVYIVKQSCLSNAVSVLTVGAKTPPDTDKVLSLAQEYVDWVFNSPKLSLEAVPNDLPEVD